MLLLLLLSCFSRVRLCVAPETAAHQAPPSLGFSGKNTGVGFHFLLQCMKVKSESEVAYSPPTLGGSMDCSPPGSSVHGIFQARVLEWGAIALLMHIYGIYKDSNDNPVCKTAKETQMYRTVFGLCGRGRGWDDLRA